MASRRLPKAMPLCAAGQIGADPAHSSGAIVAGTRMVPVASARLSGNGGTPAADDRRAATGHRTQGADRKVIITAYRERRVRPARRWYGAWKLAARAITVALSARCRIAFRRNSDALLGVSDPGLNALSLAAFLPKRNRVGLTKGVAPFVRSLVDPRYRRDGKWDDDREEATPACTGSAPTVAARYRRLRRGDDVHRDGPVGQQQAQTPAWKTWSTATDSLMRFWRCSAANDADETRSRW
ncbi:hypothetical protein ShzoTeo12_53730 (plasmid) [Shinella zoogloeoides]|nr:hypothetical protein ShzoTeo12_53730 [Shinella zoogloeoides]